MDDIESCRIPLRNRNKEIIDYTIISREDYDEIMKYKWYKTCYGYASGHVHGKDLKLHRYIMILNNININKKIVDHINHNKLDNRRINLRVCDHRINSQNKRKRENTISNYVGTYITKNNRFRSTVQISGIEHYLGTFDTDKEAAYIRDHYLVSRDDFKELGFKLNFPELLDEYRYKEFKSTYKKRKKSSRYIGVHFNKHAQQYVSVFKKSDELKYITYSNNEDECAYKYDEYIVNNNILNKQLNFPVRFPNYKIVKNTVYSIKDNYVIIKIKNQDCFIDIDDYEKIKQYKLNIQKNYVVMYKDKTSLLIHRYILNVNDSQYWVDHINNNTLDNRKNNLRITDNVKNTQNRKKQKNTSSEYIGVYKRNSNWRVQISYNNKYILQKTLNNEEDAARLRDLFILKNLPDEHYKLNFEWTDKDKEEWSIKLQRYF